MDQLLVPEKKKKSPFIETQCDNDEVRVRPMCSSYALSCMSTRKGKWTNILESVLGFTHEQNLLTKTSSWLEEPLSYAVKVTFNCIQVALKFNVHYGCLKWVISGWGDWLSGCEDLGLLN